MKLNNIRLLATKFDECFLFYRDILGLKAVWGNVGEVYAQFKIGDQGDLALFSKNLMPVPHTSNQTQQPADNIALIFSVDDVDQHYNSLISKGIRFINKPTDQSDWGIRVVHLRDPEGNLIELMCDLPKERYSDNLKKDCEKYS